MDKNKILEKLRNILASLIFILGFTKIRNWQLKRKQPLVRVLLIHHVRKGKPFETMIEFLVKNYHPLTFEDFLEKRFKRGKINILLTFDDGYESWFKTALPILEKWQMPALWFVSSGLIKAGENPETLEKFARDNLRLPKLEKPLTKDQLKIVSRNSLLEIGGHSFAHFFLDKVSLSLAKEDILKDKEIIEKIIQKKVRAFAYPFGRGNYSKDLQEILKEASYQVAFTTHSDFYSFEKKSPFLIPRSNHGTVSSWILKLWVEGAFDFVQKIENKIRKFRKNLRR